jgi:hypothetical protein
LTYPAGVFAKQISGKLLVFNSTWGKLIV